MFFVTYNNKFNIEKKKKKQKQIILSRFKYLHLKNKKLVYYAPREKETWTVHSSCELTPEPKARVANTSCGLVNFTPVERILFFATPWPNMPHSLPAPKRECGVFGPGNGEK